MSQLTITSYYVRKGIKIGIIGFLSFIILKTSFGIAKSYWRKTHPPPKPPPDTAYGKLPVVNFPKQAKIKPISFQLETVEAGLPTNLPKRGKVYYLPKLGGKFLSLDQANQIAQSLGLNPKGKKITENIYLYQNAINKTQLKINVLTQNFTYYYDYIHDQTLINPPPLPTKQSAVQIAQSFLRRIDKLPAELEQGNKNKEVSYSKIKGEKLVPAISPSEADFIRVNLFRKQINDQYPIMPPTYPRAQVTLLITSRSVQSKQVVAADNIYFPSDREEFAEYPFLPIEQAWEQFKSGNYFLASFDGKNQEIIKIRKIYFAYFDPPQPTHFLQPIYVFQGDNNFIGYYSAIPPEWQQ